MYKIYSLCDLVLAQFSSYGLINTSILKEYRLQTHLFVVYVRSLLDLLIFRLFYLTNLGPLGCCANHLKSNFFFICASLSLPKSRSCTCCIICTYITVAVIGVFMTLLPPPHTRLSSSLPGAFKAKCNTNILFRLRPFLLLLLRETVAESYYGQH